MYVNFKVHEFCDTPNLKNEVLKHVSVGAASKNTFYWKELWFQNLEGGMSMTKQKFCQPRFSKKFREVLFGRSRSQKVFTRVGPHEPSQGQNARDCRWARWCMCTLFFFSEKSFLGCCRSINDTSVCWRRFVCAWVLLAKRKEGFGMQAKNDNFS